MSRFNSDILHPCSATILQAFHLFETEPPPKHKVFVSYTTNTSIIVSSLNSFSPQIRGPEKYRSYDRSSESRRRN
jgi:hypothetical protein